jgi:uncharacterized protein (DUF58 family)
MGSSFVIFVIVLFFLAALTRESFVFVLLYLVIFSFLLGRWWIDHIQKSISVTRRFVTKAFPGESVPVALEIKNKSYIPAVWLKIRDFYPVEVAAAPSFQRIINLGPKQHHSLAYELHTYKRGYYRIGPSQLTSGDLLGLVDDRIEEGPCDYLTVYPKLIALPGLTIPSRSPLGTIKHSQPIFEDPSRPWGKRDYQSGDSIRRIDWKASAAAGKLQVKIFEPSIALEAYIYLNLNSLDYSFRTRFDATELAITTAASIAARVVDQKQSIGLVTNGFDPGLGINQSPPAIPPRKGRNHLMRILETLARIKSDQSESFVALINKTRADLSWGTTIVIITGLADKDLYSEIFQARRSGLNPLLILCGENPEIAEIRAQTRHFEIPFIYLRTEKDLDIWRK